MATSVKYKIRLYSVVLISSVAYTRHNLHSVKGILHESTLRYAECHDNLNVMLNVVMLSVVAPAKQPNLPLSLENILSLV